MVHIDGLCKTFGSICVLNNISLDVKKGEVVAVIGPSGAGKSTFLRCINLLEKPTAGKIIINGEEITNPKNAVRQIRSKIGMVFQHFNLFNHMTIINNMTYAPIRVKGMPKTLAKQRAMELLERVGLKDKADMYPATLSGGQKQRVAIARALAMDPEIILFDEPTSALDPEMVSEVLSVIEELAKTGITMILVTHEMAFAQHVANRILFMSNGMILEDSSPKQFFAHPQTERAQNFLSKML